MASVSDTVNSSANVGGSGHASIGASIDDKGAASSKDSRNGDT